jgi:tetratricopeptide (TPR) repeat protein
MKEDLRKAHKLFRAGQYSQVVRLLEPQIFRYRQNLTYFYLLGTSCLRTGDLSGADTYLKRALAIKPADINSLLSTSIVHIKRQETSEAISCLLQVLDEDSSNRLAGKGLSLIKKNVKPEQMASFAESARIYKILPSTGPSAFRVVLISLIILASCAALSFGVRAVVLAQGNRVFREREVDELSIKNITAVDLAGGAYRYILSEKQIKSSFQNAKSYFAEYRDNFALREINRLLNSNASSAVKEQANIIRNFISPPDFTTFRDPFTFQEVNEDPHLYAGTYIVWKGKISNLFIGETEIRFDFLVGYETNQVLDGIVAVIIDFAATISQSDPLELLAEIVPQEDDSFYLKGISIHKIKPK